MRRPGCGWQRAVGLFALLLSTRAPATTVGNAKISPFNAAPAAAAAAAIDKPIPKRPPHEFKEFLDKFRGNVEDAEDAFEAMANAGASPASTALLLELLRADKTFPRVLTRALRSAELDTVIDEAFPADKDKSRARQLVDALKDGSLRKKLGDSGLDTLAGALRIELRSERSDVADDKKLPPTREVIAKELLDLARIKLPVAITDAIRELRKLPRNAAIGAADLKALAQDNTIAIPKLLNLLGRMSAGADSLARTVSPVTSPRRLRELRDTMQASGRCGKAPASDEPFFSIPGHSSDDGGVSLDEGGPRLRVVEPPNSSEIVLPKKAEQLDEEGIKEANRLKKIAEKAIETKNPVYPIELFSGKGVAQCNGSFASSDGKPIRLGRKDEDGKEMCEVPYQTAAHCVNPSPDEIRITRLSRRPFRADRIVVSRTGDQATIGIEMTCDAAAAVVMLPIASPEDIGRAQMGIMFLNPKRHGDDGAKFLITKQSLGNPDFLGFNADLVDDKNVAVNGPVGTRVGDSGGLYAVVGSDGKLKFAGANSFGVFKQGDPKQNPSLYAKQGGIAFGGKTQTIALINKARELASPGVFTAARLPGPSTHKGTEEPKIQ